MSRLTSGTPEVKPEAHILSVGGAAGCCASRPSVLIGREVTLPRDDAAVCGMLRALAAVPGHGLKGRPAIFRNMTSLRACLRVSVCVCVSVGLYIPIYVFVCMRMFVG